MIFLLLASALSASAISLNPYTHFNVIDNAVVRPEDFACLRKSNATLFKVYSARGYKTNGVVDRVALTNLQNAQSVNYQVDVTIEPCATCSASGAAQAQTLLNSLSARNITIRQAWIDFEGTIWYFDVQKNRQLVTDMGKLFDSQKVAWGVRATADRWDVAVGITWNNVATQNKPLWWPLGDGATEQTPLAYVPFGGWSSPTIHQYAIQVDLICPGVGMYQSNIGYQ